MSQLTTMFAAQSASKLTAVTTLSNQIEAQSSALERQLAANSIVLLMITDCLNHLEQNLDTRPAHRITITGSRLVPFRVSQAQQTLCVTPALSSAVGVECASR